MNDRQVRCPACGGEMERKRKDFSIGSDGGSMLQSLLADTYAVDLYACPQCGKVELYTAGDGMGSDALLKNRSRRGPKQ